MPHRRGHIPSLWDAAIARQFFELPRWAIDPNASIQTDQARHYRAPTADMTPLTAINDRSPVAFAFQPHPVADADFHNVTPRKSV
jgi:hypothetical protein